MKKSISILMIIMLCFNQACGDKEDNCQKTIAFENTTTKSLYVTSSHEYPDTLSFIGMPNPVLDPNFTKVLPNESNTQVLWSRDCIESDFKYSIPSDTMMIYVFDTQVLETTPWDTVKANYLVLRRYDLSLDDLNKMDWTITYP